MSDKQKRYASITNPTMNAVVNRLFRLPSEEEARERLELIRSHFILSTKQLPERTHPCVHLWIKGYEVTPQEQEKGVIGNFALISYQKNDGKWVLSATKLETPAELHPQRAQIMRDNPNWGHPVLRSVRKGKHYDTLEDAQSELNLLHEHFPKVTIPNMGKLYIMIYCSDRPAKQRMVKHILEIKLQPDASYLIECKENMPKTDRPIKKRITTQQQGESPSPQGYFSAKVTLGRHKKGKPKPKTDQSS